MKNIFNKANAPYLVSGALATSALLASGVFTVAPYIGFLAPVAALSVGLPLIVVAAVFSFVTIAFSCAAISKNNTIAEKKDQLNQQSNEIARLKKQLDEKEIDVRNYKNSEEGNSASRLAKAAVAGTMATGGIVGVMLGGITGGILGAIVGQSILGVYVDNSKEGEARRKATVDNAVHVWDVSQSAFGVVKSSVKYTCGSIIECSKSSINSVGTVLKSVCNVIPHSTANLNFSSMID
ncbi:MULTISPECIES: hypothetical protein [unclassified Wolbachia]|uniref:hypothetical protein n=1 Tax=unclassified Wolbachia TaxID=2640676 RepID=UPI0022307E4A|nr:MULTISPECIES: hypothetical protein [unclassified Wolbachia]